MGDTSTTADQATTESMSSNQEPTSTDGATGGNPPAVTPPADSASTEPQRLPDDHPLVTALAAQKTKTSALQAEVDKIPATVAASLRRHLIEVHQIDEATASTLVTGTTAETVLKQVAAITGLSGPAGASAPKLGTTTKTPPSEEAAFVADFFGGSTS